jgi:hypothetical protein
MSEKLPNKTFIPAPGTYAIADGRDDAELDAFVPFYAWLEPVIAWEIKTDDGDDPYSRPVYLPDRAGNPIGFLLGDGRVMSDDCGCSASLEEFTAALQAVEAERGAPIGRLPKPKLVTGGVR